MDISDDYRTLYVMDLTNRQLLEIDIASESVTASYAISDPGCKHANDVRPFGVSYLDGDVYVGVSCSDETVKHGNSDSTAHVMRLSGGSFTNVVNGSLRGYYWSHFWELNPNGLDCGASDRNTYVPMVTNMELDENGNMVVGVTGINAWRYASRNYAPIETCSALLGDVNTRGFVLHATPNGSNWDVAASEETTNSTYTHRYKDGQYVHWGSGGSHTFMSGMSASDCSGQEVVMVNLMDPLNHESAGTRWMRTSDAQHETASSVGDTSFSTSEASTLEHYHGIGSTWEKSAGMGDLEYLRTPPISIGDTVWFDENQDGIQNDGADAGIENVTIELYDPASSSVIATTRTNTNGNYHFTDVDGIQPTTSYQLRIKKPDANELFQQLAITSKQAGSDNNLDSDATESGNYWVINLTSPADNTQDLSFDFGFINTSTHSCVSEGQTGTAAADTSLNVSSWNFSFSGESVLGFCSEAFDFGPQPGDNYQVSLTSRQAFTATQKDKLARSYAVFTDPDILFSVVSDFPVVGSKTPQRVLDHIMGRITWYYTDFNEDFNTISGNFIGNPTYSATEQASAVALAQKIIDRVDGANGEPQYEPQPIYWLWNMTNSGRQDMAVPAYWANGLACENRDFGDAPANYSPSSHNIAGSSSLSVGQSSIPDSPDNVCPLTSAGIIGIHQTDSGRVFVGGQVTAFNGSNITSPRLTEVDPVSCNSINFNFEPTDDGDGYNRVTAINSYGDFLIVGGEFSRINGQTRQGLAIIDISSNTLLPWNPGINGLVHAIAVDTTRGRLHVGGDFGYRQYDISGITSSSSSFPTLLTSTSSMVLTLHFDKVADRVFMGGNFNNMLGVATADRFASLNLATNTLETTPAINRTIYSISSKPGEKVYLLGDFTTVGGTSRDGLAALDLPGLTLNPNWAPTQTVASNSSQDDNSESWNGKSNDNLQGTRYGYVAARIDYLNEYDVVIARTNMTELAGQAIQDNNCASHDPLNCGSTNTGSVHPDTGQRTDWSANLPSNQTDALIVANHGLLAANGRVFITGSGGLFARYTLNPVVNKLYLGDVVDDENGPQSSVNADGDGGDEDGITTVPEIDPGDNNYKVDVKVTNDMSNTAYVTAWIDFDKDGVFESDEANTGNITVGSNRTRVKKITWDNAAHFPIPADYTGVTYMRVRVSTTKIATDAEATTLLSDDGEIEDYLVTMNGTIISNRGDIAGTVYVDVNGNDTYNSGSESGISDITVTLYNDTSGAQLATTTTDVNGDYQFNDLDTLITYRISVDDTDSDLPLGSTLGTTSPLTGVTVTNGATTNDQDFGFDLMDGTPFTCESGFYQYTESPVDSGNFSIAQFNVATSTYDNKISLNKEVNGLGYNALDGYIYGAEIGGNQHLMRIDADGNMVDTGIQYGTTNVFAGDVDDKGVWYGFVNATNEVIRIDLTASPLTVTTTPFASGILDHTADMAYSPAYGKFYGLSKLNGQDNLYIFDPATNVMSTMALSGDVKTVNPGSGNAFGAAWWAADNYLYAAQNQTGDMFKVDVTTGETTHVATVITEIKKNDGIACATSNAPFGGISGTVYEDSNGNNSYQSGAELPIANITVTLFEQSIGTQVATTTSDASGEYSFSGLNPSIAYRIEVDTSDADLPAGVSIGTTNPLTSVTVTAENVTTDQDFGFDPSAGPFSCTNDLYQSSNLDLAQTTDMGLYKINRTTSPYSLIQIGDTHDQAYNALAYRIQDNYLYALYYNELLQIASDGQPVSLGTVTGLPNDRFYAGTTDDNGFYYAAILDHTADNKIYKIDVTTTPPQVVDTITMNRSLYFWDFVYIDGFFYGVETVNGTSEHLIKIAMDGTVENIGGADKKLTDYDFGSVFTDSTGSFYAIDDGGKGFFRIDLETVSVTHLSDAAPSRLNDGASCATATIVADGYDYGDAPNTYKTMNAVNGPRHVIVNGGPMLGHAIDNDSNGIPTSNADGDDTLGIDDEEGVSFLNPISPGADSIIHVATTQPNHATVYLNAWIDFNEDGDFADAGEQIADDVIVTDTASHTVLSFKTPITAQIGKTFARFRLSSQSGLAATGTATDGEVEDYAVNIQQLGTIGDYVWNDLDNDGVQGIGDEPLEGVMVKLIRPADGSTVKTTFTDVNGQYRFEHLLPDTYALEFVTPLGFNLTSKDQGGDDTRDSDANSSTGYTDDIVLAAGEQQLDWDAGFVLLDDTVTSCTTLPYNFSYTNEILTLPKFDSTLGTLNNVEISAYSSVRQLYAVENVSSTNAGIKLVGSQDSSFGLPSGNLTLNYNYDSGDIILDAFDGSVDYAGTSGMTVNDWIYETVTRVQAYTPVADFIAANPGDTIDVPYSVGPSSFTWQVAGGNARSILRTQTAGAICVTYEYDEYIPPPVQCESLDGFEDVAAQTIVLTNTNLGPVVETWSSTEPDLMGGFREVTFGDGDAEGSGSAVQITSGKLSVSNTASSEAPLRLCYDGNGSGLEKNLSQVEYLLIRANEDQHQAFTRPTIPVTVTLGDGSRSVTLTKDIVAEAYDVLGANSGWFNFKFPLADFGAIQFLDLEHIQRICIEVDEYAAHDYAFADIQLEDSTCSTEVDLSLKKRLATGQANTVNPGESVTFTLEVTNEGSGDATEVELIDYIPGGLTLNDSDWTEDVATNTATYNNPLPLVASSGAPVTVDITFTANSAIRKAGTRFGGIIINDEGECKNAAEIKGFAELSDVDSIPDSINGNDFSEDDYDVAQINIVGVCHGQYDFGDAPDNAEGESSGNYRTQETDNGARHLASDLLYLGSCVDTDDGDLHNVMASADDITVSNNQTFGSCASAGDDEDGLTPPALTDNQVAPALNVTVFNNSGNTATLSCWADYNADGVFDNATERGQTSVSSTGASQIVQVTLPDVPATAGYDTNGETYLRCRVASANGADNPVGSAADGEVEDYKLIIQSHCSLSPAITHLSCDDRGTADDTDDRWSFESTVTATDVAPSTNWQLTGDLTDNGTYGISKLHDVGLISSAPSLNLTFADALDSTCKAEQQISAPANCSAGCTISASKGAAIIDDKGTASSDDDELSLQVTVTGVSPAGASWEALRETSSGYANLGTVAGDRTVTLTVLVREILSNDPNGFTLRIQQTNYTDCFIELFVNMPNTANLQVDKVVRGAAAPANWEFTLASANCSLPGGLTNPISVSGSGGSNTFNGLTVYATDGSSCIYSITENDQDGYVLSTEQSDDLDNITLVPDQTTIVNVVNDEELYVLITDNSIVEGNSGTRSLAFVVELSNTSNPRNLFLRNQLRNCATKVVNESFNGDINNWTAVNFASGDCEWAIESNKLKEDRSSILRGCKGFLNYPLDAELYHADTNIYNVKVKIDSNYNNSVFNLGDNNDVGIVFGYKNQSNYYLARWKDYGDFYAGLSQHRYLQLIKVVDGESTTLDEKEIDLPEEFTLKVDVNASGIQVLVDNQIELQSTTDQPVLHEFGVYSRDNDDAVFFDNLHAQTFCPPVPPEATSTNDVEMEYEVVDGTASVEEGDYLPIANGQATIPAGQNYITIPVEVVGDTRVEADETFVIRLTNIVNGVPLDVEATGTIIDDDSVSTVEPTISIADNSTLEGNSGTKNLSFTVSLSEPAPDSGVSMNYNTSDGTAMLGNNDYQSTSGTLTILPGLSTGTINVPVVGDTVVEADETFTVNLSSPVNGVLGDASATGTIINDDAVGLPSLSIADNSTLEGDSGTKNLNFTVTLTAVAPAGGVTMDYTTANGTATLANNDYQSASGSLTIPAGNTTGTISVSIVGDTDVEPDETFTLMLSNISNATAVDNQATGTIINDDASADSNVNNCAQITSVNQADLMPATSEDCVSIPKNQGASRMLPVNTVNMNADGSLSWRSVWVNDGLAEAPYVEITAEIPEGTAFVPMPAGDFVSVDGVYCEARGASAGNGECFYEAPSVDYPQGRVVWRGTIASEKTVSTGLRRSILATTREATADLEDLANNEIVLEFVTMPLGTQTTITGEAYADWYFQGEQDSTVDFRQIASEPRTDDADTFVLPQIQIDPLQYSVTDPVSEGFQPIPSLSEWGMIVLSLLMMLVGLRQHVVVRKRYK
jgi:uncharacterized repeat protein (TIGR01451 family)